MKTKKLDLSSMSITEDKKRKLKEIFPEVFNETKIDWDKLKIALGQELDHECERYQTTWSGKANCFRIIQKPSDGTLKPCKKESVDFDKTNNIFIEGENLQVLKLLQRSYYGKVKMIYIDPPYNIGKDLIYPDNYSETLDTYLKYTGQKSSTGLNFSTNQETDGRFHSKWMNMMYSRLFLARNLLKEDGVIFISIGDKEVSNLRKIGDEIFGEENFVSTFIWEKKKKPSFLHKNVGIVTDFILCFTKNKEHTFPFSLEKTTEGKSNPLNRAGNKESILTFPAHSVQFNCKDQYIKKQDMSGGEIKTKLLVPVEIKNGTNVSKFSLKGEWGYSQKTLNEVLASGGCIRISKIPFRPNHVKEGGGCKKMKNLLSLNHYKTPTNEDATKELVGFFGKPIFSNPKPSGLITRIMQAVTYNEKNCIILDFFAGSGTTAHAVYQKNLEDGGNRKYICVQLPEVIKEDSEAYKVRFKNISEIAKERIRRVIKKIKKENKQPRLLDTNKTNLDLGLRCLN